MLSQIYFREWHLYSERKDSLPRRTVKGGRVRAGHNDTDYAKAVKEFAPRMKQDSAHDFTKPCFPSATQAQLAGSFSFVWAIACRAAAFDLKGAWSSDIIQKSSKII